MNKSSKKTIGSSSKLVKKALSKKPKRKTASNAKFEPQMSVTSISVSTSVSKELESLQEQVVNSKALIGSLQDDLKSKEIMIAKLAGEKEQLSLDLLRTRRSNDNITSQLEEERGYYFKEKEHYCKEMNQFKKLKKALSKCSTNKLSELSSEEQIESLKKKLEETASVNYGLSVKYMKIRDNNKDLRNQLEDVKEDCKKKMEEMKSEIDNLTKDLMEISKQKFNSPISPSNKKYLQILNQNSCLMFQNIQLQSQIDMLHKKLKNKLENNDINNRVNHQRHTKQEIVKLFEKTKHPDVPTLTIMTEEFHEKHSPNPRNINESKLTVFQVSSYESRISSTKKSELNRSRSDSKIVPKTNHLEHCCNRNTHNNRFSKNGKVKSCD